MTPTAALALLAAIAVPGAQPLPADPFQRTAVRALRGDYGRLQQWQRDGYTQGLATGATASRILVLTQYNGDEPDGKHDRRGRDCSLRTAASNRIAENAWVWTELSGIRQVRDCGAHSNDHRAACIGGTWVDIWFRHARDARRAGIEGWTPQAGAVIAP